MLAPTVNAGIHAGQGDAGEPVHTSAGGILRGVAAYVAENLETTAQVLIHCFGRTCPASSGTLVPYLRSGVQPCTRVCSVVF